MAEIIDFPGKSIHGTEFSDKRGLSYFLEQARLIAAENLLLPDKDLISRSGQMKFKRAMEGKIYEEIKKQRLIGSDFFLCGIYISQLLHDLLTRTPSSWYAVDYYLEQNAKRGGDICFTICSVFPARGGWREMNLSYYQKMGVGLYYEFYQKSDNEIAYHMSKRFDDMAEVAKKCLENF